MSNQYAHSTFYQQHDYPSGVDGSRSPPYNSYSQQFRPSQSQPQPGQLHQTTTSQPPPTPVSPIPLHYAHSHNFSSQVTPNHDPITAPSPQYPQQLPDIPHVGYTSPPTSPVLNGLSRRPLPTPGAPPSQFTSPPFRPPLPTPGPTPVPIPPQSHSHSSQTPTLLPSAAITQPLPSPLPSASPTSPTSSRRPLPLPRSAPGGSSDSSTRSSSPVKDAIKTFSASPGVSVSFPVDPSTHPSRFVPYWKRTLPEPSYDRTAGASSSQEAVNLTYSGISLATPAEDNRLRDRTKSFNSGRPLPPSPLDGSVGKPPVIPPTVGVFGERSRALPNPSSSPVRASTRPSSPVKSAPSGPSRPSTGTSGPFSPQPVSPTKSALPSRPISPASSDDDGKPSQNGKAHQQDSGGPSPQYGIRDLPHKSRSVIGHNHARHTRVPASTDRDEEPLRGRVGRSSTLPQAPPQSFPLQLNHRSTRSVTMRSAPAVPPGASTSGLAFSQPSSPTEWPSSLPALPRTPISSAGKQFTVNPRQEYVNLDDAPPPSLRRSPSPSGVSSRTVPPMKARSMRSSAHKGYTRDPPAPSRRSAVSVPSSPEKTTVSLPQVPSTVNRQRSRSRSVTPANSRQAQVERPRVQQQAAVSRPPPSAFSQRFVSGKPLPAEPHVRVPHISTPDGNIDDESGNASIFVSEPELPQITFSDPILDADDDSFPSEEARHDHEHSNNIPMPVTGGGRVFPPASSARRGGGLACGGCGGPIVGRIVSAMGVRWHPGCFRCSDCNDLLEYVSSYERDGKPYCHFDYHEVL
jgi:hypothetical protein